MRWSRLEVLEPFLLRIGVEDSPPIGMPVCRLRRCAPEIGLRLLLSRYRDE
jgi:hypothetical protein